MFDVRNIDTVKCFHLLFGLVSMLRTLTFILTKVINPFINRNKTTAAFILIEMKTYYWVELLNATTRWRRMSM